MVNKYFWTMRSIGPEKRPKRKIVVVLALIFLASGVFYFYKHDKKEEVVAPKEKNIIEKDEPEKAEEKNVVNYVISEGDIPAEVFAKYGKLNANEIQSFLVASENIYDFTKIKIGQELQFIFDGKEKLEKIKYYPNKENVIEAQFNGKTIEVKKENIPYEVKEETLYLRINEFLFKDALVAGLSEASILEIADIFSFDIDFTTEIREGDELKVVYEKRTLDGQAASDGKILAAKFINAGQEYRAYYFEVNGEGSHYDGEGHELVRQFLRAPLSYRYISSGFTGARYHPITKTVTAHYQIDYAAPSGTPVVATARGTLASAGWEGGWGNIIRLKHDNGYTTHYGHLSAFAKNLRTIGSVSQGQVIGYVGSTGWSTGPHLDYGLKLNGAPINPLSLKLPKGNPLVENDKDIFQKTKETFDVLLD